MKKSYKILIFNDSQYHSTRTISVRKRWLKAVLVASFILAVATIANFYYIYKFSAERNELVKLQSENVILDTKLSGYKAQIEEIDDRTEQLTALSDRITGILTVGLFAEVQEKYQTKPLAVGGKERELNEIDMKLRNASENQKFEYLEEQLLAMNLEMEKRHTALNELIDIIEEQEFTFDSTPTIWPTKGWISSPFGYRRSPFTGRQVFHEGVDIAAPYGKKVWAAAKGIVIYAGKKTGYGYLVTVDHGYGYVTRYAHNSRVSVKAGDKVVKGQEVARIGSTGRSTGPHVHFELLVDGIPVNPMRFILK